MNMTNLWRRGRFIRVLERREPGAAFYLKLRKILQCGYGLGDGVTVTERVGPGPGPRLT